MFRCYFMPLIRINCELDATACPYTINYFQQSDIDVNTKLCIHDTIKYDIYTFKDIVILMNQRVSGIDGVRNP